MIDPIDGTPTNRVGADIKRQFARLHDRAMADSGSFHWRATVVARYLAIAATIGWDPFRQTFSYFNTLDAAAVPSSRTGKFELFMDTLSEYAGTDTRSLIPPAELAWILQQL